jgi:hypothetical protein
VVDTTVYAGRPQFGGVYADFVAEDNSRFLFVGGVETVPGHFVAYVKAQDQSGWYRYNFDFLEPVTQLPDRLSFAWFVRI